MNLQSVKALEERNRKCKNISIKTNEYHHVLNYNRAINSQIQNFGWNKTRLFKPVTKDSFDFALIKYDYGSGKYYQYFTKEDILQLESLERNKKNKSPKSIELFSPKPVKKLEIENRKKENCKKRNIKFKKKLFCCTIQ